MNTKRERKRERSFSKSLVHLIRSENYIYIYIFQYHRHTLYSIYLRITHYLVFFFFYNDTPLKTTRPYTVTVSLDYVRCIEQLVATANEISAGARGRHVVGVAMRTYVADQHTSSPAHPACLLLLPLLLFQPTLATDSRGNF